MEQIGYEYRDNLLYTFIIAFILYAFASSVFVDGLPYIGIVAFSVLPLFFLRNRESIYYTFFLLPFSWYFPGYVILLLFIVLLFKNKGGNKQIQFSFTLVLVFLEIAHLLLCPFPVEWNHAISPLAFIAMFFYLLYYQNEGIDDCQCVKFYCIGSCFAVLLSYLMLIQIGGFDLFMDGAFRSGSVGDMDQNTLVLNSNAAAFLSITSFVCLLYSKERLRLPYITYYIFLILSFLLGVVSFSRTYLLVVLLTLVAYAFIASVKNKFQIVIIGLLCAIVAISYFPSFSNSIIDVFSTRLMSDNVSTAGGRTEIFMSYNKWLLENPEAIVWGAGINYYGDVSKIGHATHSGLQQILVCTGIIGLTLFFVAAMRFYKLYKSKALSLYAIMPFFICLVFDQSVQFLMPQFLMFPFVATAYIFRINSRI